MVAGPATAVFLLLAGNFGPAEAPTSTIQGKYIIKRLKIFASIIKQWCVVSVSGPQLQFCLLLLRTTTH